MNYVIHYDDASGKARKATMSASDEHAAMMAFYKKYGFACRIKVVRKC